MNFMGYRISIGLNTRSRAFGLPVYENTHKFSQISIDDKQRGKKGIHKFDKMRRILSSLPTFDIFIICELFRVCFQRSRFTMCRKTCKLIVDFELGVKPQLQSDHSYGALREFFSRFRRLFQAIEISRTILMADISLSFFVCSTAAAFHCWKIPDFFHANFPLENFNLLLDYDYGTALLIPIASHSALSGNSSSRVKKNQVHNFSS